MQLEEEIILRVEEQKYSFLTGVVYSDIFSTAEQLSDQVINISEIIKGIDEEPQAN